MISPYPTPPISPSGSSTDIPQTTIDEQVASSSTRADQDRACSSRVGRLKLVERRFGDLGREAKTADVFQAVMASRKGKERAIGEVWLDGETVSSQSHRLEPQTYKLANKTYNYFYILTIFPPHLQSCSSSSNSSSSIYPSYPPYPPRRDILELVRRRSETLICISRWWLHE